MVAAVAGVLAILLETRRGLSRAMLREQAEVLRRAADSLEIIGE